MYKICSLSDITYNREKTEREFVKLLRFKNMNAKREESHGNVFARISTSRSKKRLVKLNILVVVKKKQFNFVMMKKFII